MLNPQANVSIYKFLIKNEKMNEAWLLALSLFKVSSKLSPDLLTPKVSVFYQPCARQSSMYSILISNKITLLSPYSVGGPGQQMTVCIIFYDEEMFSPVIFRGCSRSPASSDSATNKMPSPGFSSFGW